MTIRLALIGCGSISRRHVLSMQDLQLRGRGDFVVSAVCDANQEAATERADMLEELLGVRPAIFPTYQAVIAEAEVDAVDLCLPHGLHHGVAVDSMEAGLHVLCEKPLGITVKACRLMAETAEKTGKVLSTAAPHRRHPGQRTARWILNESGLIGSPQSFFHSFRSATVLKRHEQEPAKGPDPASLWAEKSRSGGDQRPEHIRWRQDRLMSGGGPVLDSGFHYCDSLRYYLGEVDKVYAELRAVKSGKPLPFTEAPEDTVFVTFAFKSGVTGTWAWSVAAPGEEAYDVTFYGTRGSLRETTNAPFSIFHLFQRTSEFRETARLTGADGTIYSMERLVEMHRATLSPEEEEFLYPGGATDGFSVEIWEFLELLRGNREAPEIDGWEGMRSIALGDAIYESALTGEAIRYEDVLSGARSSYQDPIDAHWGLTE